MIIAFLLVQKRVQIELQVKFGIIIQQSVFSSVVFQITVKDGCQEISGILFEKMKIETVTEALIFKISGEKESEEM